MNDLEKIINDAFEDRDNINVNTAGDIRNAVDETLNKLDSGGLRVCEKINNEWQVNQWIKKAILLSFRLNDNEHVRVHTSEGRKKETGFQIKSTEDINSFFSRGWLDRDLHDHHYFYKEGTLESACDFQYR